MGVFWHFLGIFSLFMRPTKNQILPIFAHFESGQKWALGQKTIFCRPIKYPFFLFFVGLKNRLCSNGQKKVGFAHFQKLKSGQRFLFFVGLKNRQTTSNILAHSNAISFCADSNLIILQWREPQSDLFRLSY